jgi:RNA polymerase sigma factor (sigma-70 family)
MYPFVEKVSNISTHIIDKKHIDEKEKKFLGKAKSQIGEIYDDRESNQINERKKIEERRKESKANPFYYFGANISALLHHKDNNKSSKIKEKNSDIETKQLEEKGILEFQNSDAAKLFIRDLTDNLSENVNEIFNELDNMINSTKDEFIPSLNKDIEQSIGSIIVEIKERIGEDIEIKIPTLKIDKNKSKLDYFEEAIENAVNKLPERCRDIFLKCKMEGKKYREIASEMNLSVNTIENQMSIALKKLRIELKDYLPLLVFIIGSYYDSHS